MTETGDSDLLPDDGKAFGWGRLREGLSEPVDIASIAVFRVMFGAIICWEVWHYFDMGWITRYYVNPAFYFKYFGFGWVAPWPGEGMYAHFAFLGVCALCVMTGFLYRISSWLLFLGLAYWFLLDQAGYLNHLYLLVLLAFLMAVIPAHRAISLDVLRCPKRSSETIPAWCLWLLRAQVGIAYFYGGIAKLNGDWLRGEPPRKWMADRHDYAVVGPWLDTEVAVWFMSYGGLIFDLAVVPALLWRKTRMWALAACVGFHCTNACLFQIGIFPAFMTAATLLLLPPDWPRKACFLFSSRRDDSMRGSLPQNDTEARQGLVWAFLVGYLAIQLLVPFRHFLYPGNVHWTEEGQRFAWHMMVHHKDAAARFYAKDSTGKVWLVDHTEYLTPRQARKFADRPDMCLQLAHHLAADLESKGHEEVEIHLLVNSTFNSRKLRALIDLKVDLAKESRNLWPAEWIMLRKELEPEPSE